MFFSTIFKNRSSSMGFAIFLWFFFNMILPTIMIGVAFGSGSISDIMQGAAPDWYYALSLVNPLSVYSSLIGLTYGSATAGEIPLKYPSFYTTEIMALILIIWICVFLVMTYLVFKRKDI